VIHAYTDTDTHTHTHTHTRPPAQGTGAEGNEAHTKVQWPCSVLHPHPADLAQSEPHSCVWHCLSDASSAASIPSVTWRHVEDPKSVSTHDGNTPTCADSLGRVWAESAAQAKDGPGHGSRIHGTGSTYRGRAVCDVLGGDPDAGRKACVWVPAISPAPSSSVRVMGVGWWVDMIFVLKGS
jgi:hypothetical protein